jgi:hypothetical protein
MQLTSRQAQTVIDAAGCDVKNAARQMREQALPVSKAQMAGDHFVFAFRASWINSPGAGAAHQFAPLASAQAAKAAASGKSIAISGTWDLIM